MKLRNKKTGEVKEFSEIFLTKTVKETNTATSEYVERSYCKIAELIADWEDVEPAEPLIKDEKIRKAVRAWAEADNCTSEMNLYYTLNRREKYITFHNPQTGSELQLCDFDEPVFQEMREYTIAELCGEEEE